jgi:hypothetical protein
MDTFRFTTTLRQKNSIFPISRHGLFSSNVLNSHLKSKTLNNSSSSSSNSNGDSNINNNRPKRSSSPFGSDSSLSGNSIFIVSADGVISDDLNGESNERPPPCGAKPNQHLTTMSESPLSYDFNNCKESLKLAPNAKVSGYSSDAKYFFEDKTSGLNWLWATIHGP